MKTMIMFLLCFLLFLAVFLLALPTYTTFKSIFSRGLLSPFECGFDPYHSSRVPFSLQFFLIAVIFLIFDIEIVILLPLPLTQLSCYPSTYLITTMSFILLLLFGTYFEWWAGALTWST